MSRHLKSLAGISMAVLLAAPALAQQAPPAGVVLPQGQPMPPQAVAPRPVPIVSGAPTPQQPVGGFETAAPVPGEDIDPAETMNLNGAQDFVGGMNETSDRRLSELTGATVSPATASDLEEMMAMRRQIMMLGLKNEQAELAVSLWGTLYNNEHAQAARVREDERAAKAEEEAAKAQEAAVAAAQQAQISALQGGSVVWPVVAEVTNGTATLLVPNAGVVTARAGAVLPGGFKITSVSSSGVKAEHDGQVITLGFGTTLASPPPVMPAQSMPAAVNPGQQVQFIPQPMMFN